MTEPPADDNWAEDDLPADEFLAALEEDALIDEVGQGGGVPETPVPGQGVARALRRLRDWGMQDPITTPPWEVHAEKPLPPWHTTGGNVPISDDAAQLLQMAEDGDAVRGQLGSVSGRVNDAVGAIDGVATALDDAAGPSTAAADYVTTVAGTAQGLLGGAEGDQVAGLGMQAAAAINDVTSTLLGCGAAITDMINQLNSVESVLDTARQMVQLFFVELKAAAQRHGG